MYLLHAYKRKTIRNTICDLITLDQLYCTSVSLMSVEMFPFIFWSLVKIFKYNLFGMLGGIRCGRVIFVAVLSRMI